jgi:hypothetical protein
LKRYLVIHDNGRDVIHASDLGTAYETANEYGFVIFDIKEMD